MHTTTIDHLEAEAERTAGILEDRHEHLTTQARRLADLVVAAFTADNPGHWRRVASSLTDHPEILDSFAAQHGLPRPIDAVKCRTIALVESQALAASLSPIPPAAMRPVCVLVGWLAEHPTFAAQMEFWDDGEDAWRPATEAIDTIDAGWPVEVRLSPTPPAAMRPVCVRAGWLAEHPTLAAQMEFWDDGEDAWRPATEAIDTIDAGWPVEVRQIMHVVA